MTTYESLNHSKWDCKYHVVFIPKCRKKALYGKVRKYLGTVFHELASQRGSKILEGHMVQDHVHMLIIHCSYCLVNESNHSKSHIFIQL